MVRQWLAELVHELMGRMVGLKQEVSDTWLVSFEDEDTTLQVFALVKNQD